MCATVFAQLNYVTNLPISFSKACLHTCDGILSHRCDATVDKKVAIFCTDIILLYVFIINKKYQHIKPRRLQVILYL